MSQFSVSLKRILNLSIGHFRESKLQFGVRMTEALGTVLTLKPQSTRQMTAGGSGPTENSGPGSLGLPDLDFKSVLF